MVDFYYTGIEQLNQTAAERGTYCTFAIFHRASGLKVAEIITNASFCGSWHRTTSGALIQEMATCMYSLPNTPAGIRKALRIKALQTAALIAEIGPTPSQEREGYTLEFAQMIYDLLTFAQRSAKIKT